MQSGFLVLDFGSQFTQLIARRLREFGVYSEIHAFDFDIEKIKSFKPQGIILSGGPFSVHDKEAPQRSLAPLLEIAPVLGICYGMQLIAKELGGVVEPSDKREYGLNQIAWDKPLVDTVTGKQSVWMSHGDVVKVPPPGFELLAKSASGHAAVIKSDRVWAMQFHPEVSHTDKGEDLLKGFVFQRCQAQANWDSDHIKEQVTQALIKKVPDDGHILCALSGGVDSTVVGTLLTKIFGAQRVHCVFVNNGLLRKGEYDEVMGIYSQLGLNVKGIDAKSEFLDALKGISDPERKRKIIGRVFIDVFKNSIKSLEAQLGISIEWLAQGTLYPDVIESVSVYGKTSTIKSHHNVGGLPEDLNLKLVEPLRELFKDEVRLLGKALEIPSQFLWRHPFPGPGLAIRCLGEVNEADLGTLKDCDFIFREELHKWDIYDEIWQAFCVILPVKTVGVQGDFRTYEKTLALRAVTSRDGMTADWYDFSPEFLRHVSNRITNEVKGVNRIVYDITSKPPGTIEWE